VSDAVREYVSGFGVSLGGTGVEVDVALLYRGDHYSPFSGWD
jgi:hypothetical protein